MFSRLTQPLLALALTTLAGSLTSCSKFSKDSTASAINSATPPAVQWYQVSNTPPKYFPKGLSANTPTTAYHGFWVSDSNNQSQWFVPKNGVKGISATRLQQDAVARLKPATKSTSPKVKLPKFKAPKIKLPTVKMPKAKLPKFKMPQMQLPAFKKKKEAVPATVKSSKFNFPKIKTPKMPAMGSKIKSANSKLVSGSKNLAGKALFWREPTS